jgi:hypothetical protein
MIDDADDYAGFFAALEAWTLRAWASMILDLARAHVRLDRVTVHAPRWRYDGALVVATVAEGEDAARSVVRFYALDDLRRISALDIAEAELVYHAPSDPPPPDLLSPFDPDYFEEPRES